MDGLSEAQLGWTVLILWAFALSCVGIAYLRDHIRKVNNIIRDSKSDPGIDRKEAR